MQVMNIECQIAQAQLRRYLAGEEMPQALVSDLEAHLKGCEDCMAAAQIERQSLAGILSNRITGKARKPAAPNSPVPESPLPFLTKLSMKKLQPGKAAIQAPADMLDAPDDQYAPAKAPRKKSKISFKTVAYSLGLALILVLMSTVMKDPTAIFGPRATLPNTDTPQTPVDQGETAAPKETTGAPTEENGTTESADATGETTSSQKPADAIADNLPDKPMLGNGIIIADSEKGTTIVLEPKKGSTEPANGTVKVYPPAKN